MKRIKGAIFCLLISLKIVLSQSVCTFAPGAENNVQIGFETSKFTKKIKSLNKVEVTVQLENLFLEETAQCLENAPLELFVLKNGELVKVEAVGKEKYGTMVWKNIPNKNACKENAS